jgi:hypothetical protein
MIEGLVRLPSVVRGTDFSATGRTLAQMGIEKLSRRALQRLVLDHEAESAA